MTQFARISSQSASQTLNRAFNGAVSSLRTPLLVGLVGLSSIGCGEDRFFGATAAAAPRDSLLHFIPAAFQGDVACRPGEKGQFQSYVVDLFDPRVTADGGFAEPLATSPAANCNRDVKFLAPGVGFPFAAVIRGYDISSEQLRQQELSDVQPKWQAECGAEPRATDAGVESGGPVVSVPGTLVINTCTKLRIATETVVEVALADALADLSCGEQPGEVGTFTATVAGQSQSANCLDTLRFVGLKAGPYTIEVSAASAGGNLDAGLAMLSAPSRDAGCVAQLALDAGRASAVTDAGSPDAAVTSTGDDAGVSASPEVCAPATEAAVPKPTQWQTQCTAEVVEGLSITADCVALTVIP